MTRPREAPEQGIRATPEAILWHCVLSRAVRDLKRFVTSPRYYPHMERTSRIRSLREFFFGEDSTLKFICSLHDYDVKPLRRWAAPLLHELEADTLSSRELHR